ncbi:MAG: hypothetical protein HYW47_03995, partial [Deltaproteobacteria bacterium]|nr:hypothetical protein [Deltaproteobacteria bacterium]
MKKNYFLYLTLSFILLNIKAYGEEPLHTATPSAFYFFTNKDYYQFQEFRGFKKGFDAGFNQLTFSKIYEKKGLDLNFEGHAFVLNKDINLLLNLKNSNDPSKFNLKTGFKSFNRYFDPTGGYFATSSPTHYDFGDFGQSNKLTLFDGKYFIELGFPIFSLETLVKSSWHRKSGKMSELNWGLGPQGTTKKFSPGFSEIDQDVYEAELIFKKEVKNGDITLGQHFIYMNDDPIRREFDQNTVGKRVVQSQNLNSLHYAAHLTFFKALSEKTLTTLAYYLNLGDTSEKQNLESFNSAGARIGGGTTKNFFNATADNFKQKHSLNAHLYREAWNNIYMNLRLNAFYKDRDSDATYPKDTTSPPDFVIDQTTIIDTENLGLGLGEQLSLHYKGFNRLTPYLKLESEQNILKLTEDSITTGVSADTFYRTTAQILLKNIAALGFYSYPKNWLKLSAEYSFSPDIDAYNDTREIPSSVGSEKSAFVDDLRRFSHALKANASLALNSWLQTGLRFNGKRTRFKITTDGQGVSKSSHNTYHYTAFFSVLPRSDFSLVQSFSFNDARTKTPAVSSATGFAQI